MRKETKVISVFFFKEKRWKHQKTEKNDMWKVRKKRNVVSHMNLLKSIPAARRTITHRTSAISPCKSIQAPSAFHQDSYTIDQHKAAEVG